MRAQNWTLRRNILQGPPTPEGSGPALTGELVHRPEAERKEKGAGERVPNPKPRAPTPTAQLAELSISKLRAVVLKLERAPAPRGWGWVGRRVGGWGGCLKHRLPSLNFERS